MLITSGMRFLWNLYRRGGGHLQTMTSVGSKERSSAFPRTTLLKSNLSPEAAPPTWPALENGSVRLVPNSSSSSLSSLNWRTWTFESVWISSLHFPPALSPTLDFSLWDFAEWEGLEPISPIASSSVISDAISNSTTGRTSEHSEKKPSLIHISTYVHAIMYPLLTKLIIECMCMAGSHFDRSVLHKYLPKETKEKTNEWLHVMQLFPLGFRRGLVVEQR